jgi:hypothetical protein
LTPAGSPALAWGLGRADIDGLAGAICPREGLAVLVGQPARVRPALEPSSRIRRRPTVAFSRPLLASVCAIAIESILTTRAGNREDSRWTPTQRDAARASKPDR